MLLVDIAAGSNRKFSGIRLRIHTVTQEEAAKINTWLETVEKKSTGCRIFV